jgi:DNA-binding NarL/FixJ family response regulator
MPIRVLVADDHPVVRGGLVALLDTLDEVEVVGQVGNGADAVREAALSAPDVVVMDLRMPVLGGVAATEQIVRNRPGTGVLVLSMTDDDDLVAQALAAGARGYLVKGADPAEIERGIRAVAGGSAIFSAEVAAGVLGRAAQAPRRSALPHLTPREFAVLSGMARGLANAPIAAELGIAVKTVENHVSSVLLKLAVGTRAEAIVRARDAGAGR